jgi:hypothetical protein
MRQKPYLKKKSDRLDEKTSEGWLKAVLQYAAVPIALLSSLFYMFGRIFYETYLSYWGLSESLFPLSKEQSVIAGFFRYLVYGVSLLPKLAFVMYVLLAVVIVVLVSCYRPVAEYLKDASSSLGRKAVPVLRSNVVISDAHDKLMTTISVVTGGIVVVLFSTFVFVLSCSSIASHAKESAKKEHDEIRAGTASNKPFTSRAVLYVRNESKGFDQYSGHLIQTSATHCALYSKATGITVFPLTNVSRLVIRENKVK